MNKVELTGILKNDVRIDYDKKYCNFDLEYYRFEKEQNIKCSVYQNMFENVKDLKRGEEITVLGEISCPLWKIEDGNKIFLRPYINVTGISTGFDEDDDLPFL